ncbi:hypothetical protein ACEWY4_015589 [Coilia grayii]|uniref:HMG box domain-containing protein n=1 Tax=Coilia grayii TaxID=363190 RepID=A0ABD1JPH3_9TELE
MEAVFEEVEEVEEVESCYASMEVPSPKRRRRPKGHTERVDKTKKPRSAYLLYYFDVHQQLQHEHPELPQSEINKRISESWRRLSVADKAFYLDRASAERTGLRQGALSAAASTDVPGFRRILPRASFLLLPKGAGLDEQVGVALDEQVGGALEVCVEEGGAEPLFAPMALGSEVELAEHSVAMEMPRDDAAAMATLPHAHTLRHAHALTHTRSREQDATDTLSHTHTHTHSSCPPREQASSATHTTTVTMAMEEGLKADSTHLLAIIPNQNLLENKVVTPSKVVTPRKVVTPSNSVLMLPVLSSVEPAAKPSVKLSIKYTRRGRGSCHTPGCSFSYVTRHKPPHCPLCGLHLGGKWLAAGSRDSDKASAPPCNNGPSPWQPQKEPITGPNPEEVEPESGAGPAKASTSGGAKERGRKGRGRLPRERRTAPGAGVVAREPPPEGSRGRGRSPERSAQADTRVTSTGATTATATASHSSGRKTATGRSRGRVKSVCAAQKRPVRAILPAPTKAVPSPAAVVQFITVPSSNKPKVEAKNSNIIKTVKVSGEMCGLKPSTLKQLGHTLPVHTAEQRPASRVSSGQFIITENSLKMLSVLPYKQNTGANLDLGLSTARGRGRCKNPDCDYVYKNRHKPSHCPSCGWELRKNASHNTNATVSEGCREDAECVLDPYTPLTAAQREIQRQNTLLLLRQCVQIPESEAELHDTLTLIQELNNTQVIVSSADEQLTAQLQSSWPRFYETPATHCSLCQYPLFKGGQSSVAGQEDCWLLTESHLQTASIQIKICTNTQCLALHSLIDIHPGLFNVGNKLLVSLDLFFKIRTHLRLGQNPTQAAVAILNNIQNQPVSILSGEEVGELLALLLAGYWAFESLTLRDYNDMICGVCGIAPRVEIAQRNSSNTLLLRNVEFTWPEYAVSDEVQVDDFWLTMENEALEQAAFPSSPPITRFDASIIAPFVPPLMRAAAVINTEKDKTHTHTPPPGDPSTLVRLIHEGQLNPEQIHEHTHTQLQSVLERCGVATTPDSTKEELLESVCSLFTHVQSGQVTGPPPPSHLTAGRLSKVCPHQVVCGSKYLVRAECARDHVDLLVSSRFWPVVYVADCGHQVALCTNALYPQLANSMWAGRQGSFMDTHTPAQVSCTELQEHLVSSDPVLLDPSSLALPLHPLTRSPSRWVLHPPTNTHTHTPTHAHAHTHRSTETCPELQPYLSSSSSRGEGPDETTPPGALQEQQVTFENAAFYFLYNRLLDFLCSREVVSRQIAEVLQSCAAGQVVIRDALYRLGVAHINTQHEEEGDTEGGGE